VLEQLDRFAPVLLRQADEVSARRLHRIALVKAQDDGRREALMEVKDIIDRDECRLSPSCRVTIIREYIEDMTTTSTRPKANVEESPERRQVKP
jgi:hypothetical protein